MQDTSTGVRQSRRHKLTWPIGTAVDVRLGRGEIKRTKTTSIPFRFARSGWFVRVEGLWGAVPLSHATEPIDPAQPAGEPEGTRRSDGEIDVLN